MKEFISLIFLSGGIGSRLKSKLPKQYIKILNKPIALYSFEKFLNVKNISEIIVVCEDTYKNIFKINKNIKFATPGKRRQDSVYNGLLQVNPKSNYVLIHDSARPFIDEKLILKLINEGVKKDAIALAHKTINTLKETNQSQEIIKTIDRSKIYEMQTPQIIKTSLLKKAYKFVNENNLCVTDDLSLIELLNIKTNVLLSDNKNFKITTLFDLKLAKLLLHEKI
jgi:2-C-methyl-D-erythritol 4-phosphate cytidylyltransferase